MNQQQSHAAAVDPQALGQHYNLGNFRKEYSRSGWGCLIPLVLLVSIWVYSTAVGLASTINAFTLLVGVILLLLLIVSIYRRIKKGNLNAYLYEDGFIYCTSKGIVQQVVRWTDVAAVCHRVRDDSDSEHSDRYTHLYTVELRNESEPVRLIFGTEFAKAVEQAVADSHMHSARAAYWSPGGIAHFGRLAMGQLGLYDMSNQAMLPWNEVESIKVSRSGKVYVSKWGDRRAWAYFRLEELNNPEVLRRLIATEVPYRFEVSLSR